MVCDLLSDCSDGSDEDFCVFPPCAGSEPLQCADRKEVSGSLICALVTVTFFQLLFVTGKKLALLQKSIENLCGITVCEFMSAYMSESE